MKKTFDIPMLDDMHLHVREKGMLPRALQHSLPHTGRAIIMPNLKNPIRTGEDAQEYRDDIMLVAQKAGYPNFKPLMTIAIQDSTTPSMIRDAYGKGVFAGKVYPLGVTTHSHNGLKNFFSEMSLSNFDAMQRIGMPLLIHGEVDYLDMLVTDRSRHFVHTLVEIVRLFPKLKVVLEHLSTKEEVEVVAHLPSTVAGTITAHHLYMTLNDVVGYGIRPHNMCMPIPKGFDDRKALIEAATSGNPKFFLGSDSAPHLRSKKECAVGASGVFTSPILPELLAQVFDEVGRLGALRSFTSKFGADFYRLEYTKNAFSLQKCDCVVPNMCSGIVPFKAGEMLKWKRV